MDPILKNIVRVGLVSKVNPEACSARVIFQDRSDVVSYDLPILVRGSLENKDYWLPGSGEQVVCLFLPSGNAQGYILGSVYSKKDKPPVADSNKRCLKFSDGSTLEYDRNTNTLTINAVGPISIVAEGNVSIVGDVIADGVSLKTHVHSDAGGIGNSGPPVGGGGD